MNENVNKTLKSAETEDWLDLHVVRPFCYWWAVLFARLGVHPNTVTILSMIVGAASAAFFATGSWYYAGAWGLGMNAIGIALLCLADIFDCTDGQLARMTGQKSRLGRILDGVAGFAWFLPIYHALVYRFYVHHDLEFTLLGIADTEANTWAATAVVFVLGWWSGLAGLAGQQRMADYYIQAHLLFLKGEQGAELDNSRRQRQLYDQMTPQTASWVERLFQWSYVGYTRKQEQKTPELQRLLATLLAKYGSFDRVPQAVRDEFCRLSRPVIRWNGLLTFNFRSAWLFLFCLLDVPVMNFLWEIVAMGLLASYVNRRHERFCRQLRQQVDTLG